MPIDLDVDDQIRRLVGHLVRDSRTAPTVTDPLSSRANRGTIALPAPPVPDARSRGQAT
ncbi:hypothetical protein [Sphingomonas sp. Y38-1Y]|uniref:hypothetical protein n=1 Tax=Sphingomonas sp. Y38-1Y TaxID=3078265 RepID=UPI0028F02B83|nr:hypothetical protein [Sphingomonas sp. Y38-1Y]